ncbi:MAG: hypothetical protein JWM81_1065 [Candidatus Saccharibacteria bacterium]|nr:hypothetical protein [Candidatus Saccharibacteria bacterium]
MCDPEALDALELQFSADDIAVAANEVALIADAQLREQLAAQRACDADSDVERFAAVLDLQRANLDHIAAMATSSRAEYELRKIIESDS